MANTDIISNLDIIPVKNLSEIAQKLVSGDVVIPGNIFVNGSIVANKKIGIGNGLDSITGMRIRNEAIGRPGSGDIHFSGWARYLNYDSNDLNAYHPSGFATNKLWLKDSFVSNINCANNVIADGYIQAGGTSGVRINGGSVGRPGHGDLNFNGWVRYLKYGETDLNNSYNPNGIYSNHFYAHSNLIAKQDLLAKTTNANTDNSQIIAAGITYR